MYNLSMRSEMKISKRLTSFILIIVLVVSLIVGTVLTVKLGQPKIEGVLGKNSYDELPPIVYNESTSTKFKTQLGIYILEFLNLDLGGIKPNFSAISSAILEIFQNSGISAEKLGKFGDYLENAIDRENNLNPQGIFIFESLFPSSDNGENIASIEKNFYKLFDYDAIFKTLSDIVAKTGITPYEIGKLCYHSMLFFGDDYFQTNLKKLGERKTAAIIVDFTFGLRTATNFLEEGGTLPEARLVAELIYQFGADLQEAIDILGIDFIVNIIAPENPFVLFNEESLEEYKENPPAGAIDLSADDIEKLHKDIEELKAVLGESKEAIKLSIVFVKNLFLNVKNISFEYLSRYGDVEEVEGEKYKKIAVGFFANQVHKSLNDTVKELEFIDSFDDIAEKLANFFTLTKGFRGSFETEEMKDSFHQQCLDEFKDLIKDVSDVNKAMQNIESIDDFDNIKDDDKILLDEIIAKYEEKDFSFLEGSADIFMTFIMIVSLDISIRSAFIVAEGLPT